jgi:ring-1,2-phenylacetyl-CoA epoxidase subunit PaaC
VTTTRADLLPATRNALALLLLAMADDEFVLGFSDSEWTGIAPILEEDVANSAAFPHLDAVRTAVVQE